MAMRFKCSFQEWLSSLPLALYGTFPLTRFLLFLQQMHIGDHNLCPSPIRLIILQCLHNGVV